MSYRIAGIDVHKKTRAAVSDEAKKVRARKMIRELRCLGSRRTSPGSIEQPGTIERDFRP